MHLMHQTHVLVTVVIMLSPYLRELGEQGLWNKLKVLTILTSRSLTLQTEVELTMSQLPCYISVLCKQSLEQWETYTTNMDLAKTIIAKVSSPDILQNSPSHDGKQSHNIINKGF